MPIYEYKCQACGKSFEIIIPLFQSADVKCPDCGSEKTEKLLSGFCVKSSSGSTQGSSCGGSKKFT